MQRPKGFNHKKKKKKNLRKWEFCQRFKKREQKKRREKSQKKRFGEHWQFL
jgi:hypothetical protein